MIGTPLSSASLSSASLSSASLGEWVQTSIPEFPSGIASLPHSSTISAIRMVHYDWDDLRHIPDLEPPVAELAVISEPPATSVAKLAAMHLDATPGDAVVMLTFGTIVVCPPKNQLPFAGFITRMKPSRIRRRGARTSERSGIRFNEDGIKYCIPLHRFIEDPKDVGRACLQRAQARLDSCKNEAVAAHAFAAMARSGYPPPGSADSDATVVALWRRANYWVALVVCQCFYPGVGVLVETIKPDLTTTDICELATTGRELFRRDYLEPSVAASSVIE